jgi:ribosomal protein S18 acetylase RimI-like enzyme
MLKFTKIINVEDANYHELYDLYRNSFPVNERRNWDSLANIFEHEPKFNMFALENEDEFVGFFNYWKFSRFYYIEHFAIKSQFRNKRYGTDAIKLFLSEVNMPVVLEVETPTTIIASRRIHFYERLGFYVLSNIYMQPPYDGKSFLFPMLIMSNDYHFSSKHFKLIKEVLYKEVYRYEPKNEEDKS